MFVVFLLLLLSTFGSGFVVVFVFNIICKKICISDSVTVINIMNDMLFYYLLAYIN